MKKKSIIVFILILFFSPVFADIWWFTINNYDVTLSLLKTWFIVVNEDITVNFDQRRQWIYRKIPVEYKEKDKLYALFISQFSASWYNTKIKNENGLYSARIWTKWEYHKWITNISIWCNRPLSRY